MVSLSNKHENFFQKPKKNVLSEIHGHFVQTKQIIQPGEVFVPLKVKKVRKKVAKKLSRGSSFRRKDKLKLAGEKEA